jgi:hypothetical protein
LHAHLVKHAPAAAWRGESSGLAHGSIFKRG